MVNLQGQKIILRALEPEDLFFLYTLENNTEFWEISGTINPFSNYILKEYIANSHKDIFETKQLRLIITALNGVILGCVDFFDFDPVNKRVGLGIVIAKKEDRSKGYGFEAIELCSNYAFQNLGLRQVYANVLEENTKSANLFIRLGFKKVGIKKDWVFSNGDYKNEVLFQKINK